MRKSLKYVYALVVYFFMYFPLLLTIVFSFNASRFATSWKGFTLVWYDKMLSNTMLVSSAWNSIILASTAATIASLLGTVTAIAMHRYHFKGKSVVSASLYILVMSPEIIMAISMTMMFLLLGIPLGFYTMLISHVTFCLPFVAITVMSRLAGFNKHIIEAASDLGAEESSILSKIILPMIFPAVLSGWLMSFTLSLDDVIISFFVSGGPTFEILPLRIYSMVKSGVKPDVNALCAVMFAVTSVIVWSSYFFMRRKK